MHLAEFAVARRRSVSALTAVTRISVLRPGVAQTVAVDVSQVPLLAGLDALMAASAVDLAGCYEGSESSALGASRRLASALWFIARLSATRELAPRSTPPVPPHEPTEERIPPPEHESSPAAALRPAPEVGAKGDERNAHEEPDNPHPVPVDTNRQRSPPSSFQTQSLHGHRG